MYKFLLIFCISLSLLGQPKETLDTLNYKELIVLFDENVKDTLYAKYIALTYVKKAKRDKNFVEIARGYTRLSFVSEYKEAIKYLDTSIYYAKSLNHENFPTVAYLFRSLYHYNNEFYEQSLNDAILGYNNAKQKNNIEHQIIALHQINGINELWGDHTKTLQAEKLTYQLIKNHVYINDYYERYTSSLEGLGNCYVRLKKPDSALFWFQKGINTSLKEKDTITYHAFVSRSASALYLKGDYKSALDSLIKADRKRDFFSDRYENYYYFYKAMCLEKLKKPEKALENFNKIDSIYNTKKMLFPELPLVLKKLLNHYKENNNLAQENKYLYKLIEVDSLIDKKEIFIKEKTSRDYAIPLLLESKNEFISGLEKTQRWNATLLILLSVCLLVVIIFTLYYFNRQRLFKKRFEILMESNGVRNEKALLSENKTQDVSQIITNEILEKLTGFENDKGYLSITLSLNKLAKKLNTNSSYLSKVINNEKQKNFSSYINDLRIEYAFRELKVNPTYRKFTIKAIALEAGFKNAESFSKYFYKTYGFYPSYYIKKLNKDI